MTDINALELTKNSQSFFDCFNNVIMSNDTRVFNKLIGRALLYEEVKDIPGDIVECGVFKGSWIYTFLKLKRLFNPNSSKSISHSIVRAIKYKKLAYNLSCNSFNEAKKFSWKKTSKKTFDFIYEVQKKSTYNKPVFLA